MLGLKKGTVELSKHDELWHQLFEEERAKLNEAIGDYVIAIEHVGSTSICGISAKPILDIAIAITDKAEGEKCVKPLEALGYEYRGEYGIAGRFYFVRGEPRTHHLHMVELASDAWRNHLRFRDHLRRNPEAAREYDDLKRALAANFSNDRDAYLDGKAEFIEGVLRKAAFNNK